ncbi:MAG: hypothetical protein ACPGU3_06575 [Litorivicinus sp.]
MAGALRALGGAFKAGLSPTVGATLHPDGLSLARFRITKKSTELQKLIFWRLELPETLDRKSIRPLAKHMMRGVAAARLSISDIALAVPTHFLRLANLEAEYQPPKELNAELDLDVVQFFNELDEESSPEIPDGALLHYEIFQNSKKLDIFQAKLAWIDAGQAEPYLELMRQSGLNPVVMDVEIFAIANYWAVQRGDPKTLFQKPLALLEITEQDAHLLLIRLDRWELVPVDIHEGDRVLLKQAGAQLGLIESPFWQEVFERVFDPVNRGLNRLNDWPGAVQLDELVIFAHGGDFEALATHIREQHGLPARTLTFPDAMQVDDQAVRYFDGESSKGRFLPAAAESLRTMNPYSVAAPPHEHLRLNFLPEWRDLADTRVFKGALKAANVSLILVLVALIGYTATAAWPLLTGPDGAVVLRDTEQKLSLEQQVLAVTQRDIQLAQQTLAGLAGGDSASASAGRIWEALAPALPVGVVLDYAQYQRETQQFELAGEVANAAVQRQFESDFAGALNGVSAQSPPEWTLPEGEGDDVDSQPRRFVWTLQVMP